MFKGFLLHSQPANADPFPEEMGKMSPAEIYERCVIETITYGLEPTREAEITSFSSGEYKLYLIIILYIDSINFFCIFKESESRKTFS